MKYTNNGIIGNDNSDSTTPSNYKSGNWDLQDVYQGRTRADEHLTSKNLLISNNVWANAAEDPDYEKTEIHLPEPPEWHLARDWSSNQHDEYLILDASVRSTPPVFFGPRYQHWSAIYGEGGYIKLNETSSQLQFGTDPFTIEFWLKRLRNDNTDHFIMGFGNTAGISGGTGFAIYITAQNKLAFVNASTSVTITGATTLTIDDWIHVACVRTSTAANSFKIYINGALDATGTCANFHPTNSTSFYIGRDRVATAGTFFGGQLTDIRITKSAVYNNAFPVPTAPLDMSISNVIFHDSVANRRFYTDYSNGQGIPLTIEGSHLVKITDSPFFTETTKTPQAHGTHSGFTIRQNYLKFLDIQPSNTSLKLGTSAFTVEGWIYIGERNSQNGICGKGNANNGWSFYVDSSNRLRWAGLTGTDLYNAGTITNNFVGYGGWNHVAAVREGTGTNQFKLYVNGKLDFTGTNADNYFGTDPLYILSLRDATSLLYGFACGIRISKVARYTSNFDVSTTAFIDSSMSTDSNVSLLTLTCGTYKLIPTHANYIDYGKARVPQIFRGSEVRWGQHHPTSTSGWSWGVGTTGQSYRTLLKSNCDVGTWTKVGTNEYKSIDCGTRYTMAVGKDNTLWGWGLNEYGQLGCGDQLTRSYPVKVSADNNWQEVSCGYAHTAAIRTNGTLWAWGLNNYGQLGQNDTAIRLLPVQIGTDTDWVDVKCIQHWDRPCTIARKSNGTLWICGRNDWSFFGNGTSTNSSVLVPAGGGADVAATAITSTQNGLRYIITSVGTTDWTLLGATSNTLYHVFTKSGATTGVGTGIAKLAPEYTHIFVGRESLFGIRSGGTLWAWGNNYNGRYGVGNATWQGSPINVGQNSGASTYIWGAVGRDYHMVIRSDGTLWAAGWGGYGQLGNGDGNEKQTWTQVGAATNWTKVWAGWYTTWALNSAGELYTFGRGFTGETGDNDNFTNYWSPVLTGGGIDWTQTTEQCKGGESHMMLLGTNGNAYTCGFNSCEQLGLNLESGFNWGTGDFSFEFWLNGVFDHYGTATGSLASVYIFSARLLPTDITNGDEQNWSIRYINNWNTIEIDLGYSTVLADNYGKAPISRKNWTHFCWQRVNGNMCLYGNGKKLDEIYYPHKIRALGNFIHAFNEAPPYLSYTSGFLGAISDIRINKGTAAYASGNRNPETITVPTEPLKPITGTVFLTANSPIQQDTSGQTQYYNNVMVGNQHMVDYNPVSADIYVLSQGPYTNNDVERNTMSLIKPNGDIWDGTNISEGRGYFYAGGGQYPEYAWITRMVKPWTIEFWSWGYNSYHYTGQITNVRKLYTATSGGHNGWEVFIGRESNGATTRAEKWGCISFTLWTAQNSGRQDFTSTTSKWFKPHGWNHIAVVYDPSSISQKMAIFLNGYRVASRNTALTGSTKNWNTYYLYNDSVGISGYRISNIARYNPNNTTYEIPYNGYTIDNNTVSVVNSEAPYFNSKTSIAQLSYGTIPSYKNKKLGRGSWRFNSLNDQGTGLIDRFYYARNSWGYNTLDIRHNDITMECWAQWWDHASAALEFDGTRGIRLPNSTTLNTTNGTVEFWIKAPFVQQDNPTIIDATTNGTGSYIAIGGLSTAKPGKLIFTVRQGTCSPIYSKTSINDNQWHHIVCCHYQQSASRSTGAIFIDGALEAISYDWIGSSWYFQDGQIGWSRLGTGITAGYAFTGKLANFHYHSNALKYISTWNKFSKTPFEPFFTNYWNESISDTATTPTDITNKINYTSGKIPIQKMPLPRTTATILLLNAENITVEQSPIGTVGSITGTGPWTATITGMTTTTNLAVGTPLISADNRTGALFGGTPTSVVVASVINSSSITYTVTGGTTPVAGTIANIRVPGESREDSANNFTLTVVNGRFPIRNTVDRPYSTYASVEETTSRPLKVQEIQYGGSLFNYNGGPHVFRTEDGTWAFSISSDFTYDQLYPRRTRTIRTNIRAKCSSDGTDQFDHVVLQRVNQNWILWINGIEAGRLYTAWLTLSDRPITQDNMVTDYTNTYIYLGTHSAVTYNRSWSGYIQDFKVSLIPKYETRVLNNIPTMCYRGTHTPALPTQLGPRK